MVKSEYEKLLKRISDKISDGSTKNSTRFEIPPVDVAWEGQKTFLRNFSEYPKILRRDPDKIEYPVSSKRILRARPDIWRTAFGTILEGFNHISASVHDVCKLLYGLSKTRSKRFLTVSQKMIQIRLPKFTIVIITNDLR